MRPTSLFCAVSGVSDSDDLNDRSNGDRGDVESDSRRTDRPYKYNYMVTFGELPTNSAYGGLRIPVRGVHIVHYLVFVSRYMFFETEPF